MTLYACIIAGARAIFTGFTNGNGQIWLDNVNCRGTETTLASCPHLPFGTHNCAHIEDAGVTCQALQRKDYIATLLSLSWDL